MHVFICFFAYCTHTNKQINKQTKVNKYDTDKHTHTLVILEEMVKRRGVTHNHIFLPKLTQDF